MSKVAIVFLGLFWSVLSWAQGIPSVAQWTDIIQEVHRHPLFRELNISYAKAPAENVSYSPVGVMPREGLDCVVVISEGNNPRMELIMKLTSTPENARAFLLTMAAHELGHCFRIRSKHLSVALWERVAATTEGSAERQSMQKLISIEEAYADAYAFAYIQDAHPGLYTDMFEAMHSLRYEPAFATPFYQVEPLYELLGSRGLDVSLSFQNQVETAMQQSKF
ncbi:hypothetical protein [Rhodoferax sp. UBA5149]|uniref:hypothetical protein n=1 Tax=Rhodoferax sp. UBA5149 TaxID=1947379 RepID=UPI0025D877A5|nr:hypothetical protein [Rhodoferax sp. UBA5149]